MKAAAVVVGLFLLFGGFTVRAETVEELYNEQLEASGAEELIAALPEETQALLEKLGLNTLKPVDLEAPHTETVLQQLISLAAEALRGPLSTAGMVLATVLLYAWVEGMRQTLRSEETSAVFGTVCALAVCGSLLLPLTACIKAVGEAMASVGVFMASFVPVYAGVLLSSGHSATALSFQSVVLYVSQLLSWLAGGVITPLLTIALALGVTGSVTPHVRLGGAGKLIGKTAVWILTLGMLLFTGLLSLQSFTGAAADNVGVRVMKFSIASFVPVVGGSLSEMFSTVRGCLQLLKTALGGFGAAASALIVLPPLLRCFGWQLLLAVCRMATDLFELRVMSEILEAAHGTVKSLIGILCACGAFLIIAVTVVSTAIGG